jgi:iron complex outermembrane receptor protein
MQTRFMPAAATFFFFLFSAAAWCQNTGTLRGSVSLEATGAPLHRATVTIVQLRRSVVSDDQGNYEIADLPPGTYDVTVHMEALTDQRQSIQIVPGGVATANFTLRLSPIREMITVTAGGHAQSTFEAFQSVTTLGSLDLAQQTQPSLGEMLNNQPGVAKRSFGPGSSRPVIRGFDGDRVLVLQDGINAGTLASQSGDHGEVIDSAGLERIEIVKGPGTLLWGSNAIGGVVHAVSRHHEFHDHPHEGLSGFLTGVGGSANSLGGGSAGFEYGVGRWLLWGSGGGQRTGEYQTPLGAVENSQSRIRHGSGGFGYYRNRSFFSLGYGYQDGRYGIPPLELEEEEDHDEEEEEEEHGHEDVEISMRRHNLRFNGGFRDIGGGLDSFRLSLNYSDYRHNELEEGEIGTRFFNKRFDYRGVFTQRQAGRLSGSFGFQGLHRDYEAVGEESLAPPVQQDGFAVFALEEVDLERLRLQFGGRVEHNRYDPTGLVSRSFTGFSGAAGVHVGLWRNGAFVANYTRSYRAPALEELYNEGPHLGNLAFEIGNPELRRERGDGVDFAVRHANSRLRAEVNLFRHDLAGFVFLAPTGEVDDGLLVAEWEQGDSRFYGSEALLDVNVHPNLWLNFGMDYVNARLKESDLPLPRIPPLRGRVGLDARFKGLSIKPELLLAKDQDRLFTAETRTPGYSVFNLRASYTVTQQHAVQMFSLEVFNAGNRLYRNHLSFIKEFAPEIGRGVRFTYSLRFF